MAADYPGLFKRVAGAFLGAVAGGVLGYVETVIMLTYMSRIAFGYPGLVVGCGIGLLLGVPMAIVCFVCGGFKGAEIGGMQGVRVVLARVHDYGYGAAVKTCAAKRKEDAERAAHPPHKHHR